MTMQDDFDEWNRAVRQLGRDLLVTPPGRFLVWVVDALARWLNRENR